MRAVRRQQLGDLAHDRHALGLVPRKLDALIKDVSDLLGHGGRECVPKGRLAPCNLLQHGIEGRLYLIKDLPRNPSICQVGLLWFAGAQGTV